jgi:thiamine pyrophosphate-dependent acetolactate synthase large subunit-like protein
MAEAAGLLGLTAERAVHVRPMIIQALQHDGPTLVDVHVSRQELSMLPTISLEQMPTIEDAPRSAWAQKAFSRPVSRIFRP